MKDCDNKTCFTLTELKKIAKQLKIKNVKNYRRHDNKKLLHAIQKKLKNMRPKGPVNDYEPLKSSDIFRIMKHYQKVYLNFEFLGVFPIDITRSYISLKNLNFKKLKSQNKKLAIVWNTDVSNGPGEHWICLFINFAQKTICYFDSLADKIESSILETLKYIKQKHPDYKVFINKTAFQKGYGNCGIFVIYFILSQLEGNTCSSIFSNHDRINDDLMNKMRPIYFKK